MPKIDIDSLPVRTGSGYPAPHDKEMDGRSQIKLGDPSGLTQFGANLVRLEPGAKSSLMHWHEQQDEFLVVTEGALMLVEESGETPLNPGDCCAFPAGNPNGHHIVNRSDAPGSFVVVGTRTPRETAWYSGLDLKVDVDGSQMRFLRLDGTDANLPAGPTWDVFDRVNTQLTQALLGGDFARYRGLIGVPFTIKAQDVALDTLDSETALEADFLLHCRVLQDHGVTDIRRRITHVEDRGPEHRSVACSVSLLGPSGPVINPVQASFRFERRDAVWKLTMVNTTQDHIAWTRGATSIPPETPNEPE